MDCTVSYLALVTSGYITQSVCNPATCKKSSREWQIVRIAVGKKEGGKAAQIVHWPRRVSRRVFRRSTQRLPLRALTRRAFPSRISLSPSNPSPNRLPLILPHQTRPRFSVNVGIDTARALFSRTDPRNLPSPRTSSALAGWRADLGLGFRVHSLVRPQPHPSRRACHPPSRPPSHLHHLHHPHTPTSIRTATRDTPHTPTAFVAPPHLGHVNSSHAILSSRCLIRRTTT